MSKGTRLFPVLLLSGLLGPPPDSAAPGPAAPRLVGAAGQRLPFACDAEMLDFLAGARVVSSVHAPGGVTGARKLLLERDGVRAHAIHRRVDVSATRHVFAGRFVPHYRDHHVHEVAAYRLAVALGLETVPPTVARAVQGVEGSLQLWIEGAHTELQLGEREMPILDRVRHGLQVDQMRVFDNLVYNMDRNLGNYLTDASGHVWYVDHTRSFARVAELSDPDKLSRVGIGLWKRLREIPDGALIAALAPYLEEPEIGALLQRRRLLVEALRARLEREGPNLVLFDLATWGRPRS